VSELIRVADGAYPHPPYTFLPDDVMVWAGYLGGHTPHPWTAADIADARRLVGAWWGIWTAPDRRAITATDGVQDAAGTVARLVELSYPRADPVFYDVEYATWQADPAGARAAITAWKRGLAAAGYRNAYAYVPLSAGFDWIAHWTGARPTSLPAGVIGIQYDHGLFNDAYDISVFDASLLGGSDMLLTHDDLAAIAAAVRPDLARLAQWVAGRSNSVFAPSTLDGTPEPDAVYATKSDVAALKAQFDQVLKLLAGISAPVQGNFTISGSGTVGGP